MHEYLYLVYNIFERKVNMKRFLILFLVLFLLSGCNEKEVVKDVQEDTLNYAFVIGKNDEFLLIQDNKGIIYEKNISGLNPGDMIKTYDDISNLNDYEIISDDDFPLAFNDNGIFKDYYNISYQKVKNMSLDEKIGQILLVRYPSENQTDVLEKYQFGGYVFYAKDFNDKTKDEVIKMINDNQNVAKTPILTAVDEEGGKVNRISTNSNLANEPFKSPRELYLSGGFDLIKEDTIKKSKLLYELGINLNLAPVADVSTNPNDYMYSRTLGENTDKTSEYVKTVIKSSNGLGVTYTLKHFPGYGNNTDTHQGTSLDNRSYDDILNNDLPPFKVGIDEGALSILVSHNIVSSIDSDLPSSLSYKVHNLLRDNLNFTGIVITDDLDMGAIGDVKSSTVKAVLSGNDLIITTDYESSINAIKEAINNGEISDKLIDKTATRVIAFKYYKGMIKG